MREWRQCSQQARTRRILCIYFSPILIPPALHIFSFEAAVLFCEWIMAMVALQLCLDLRTHFVRHQAFQRLAKGDLERQAVERLTASQSFHQHLASSSCAGRASERINAGGSRHSRDLPFQELRTRLEEIRQDVLGIVPALPHNFQPTRDDFLRYSHVAKMLRKCSEFRNCISTRFLSHRDHLQSQA